MENRDSEQLASLDEANRLRLICYWDLLQQEPHYPLGTQDVARLIRVADYAVDPDLLVSWASSGIVANVPREKGRLAWRPTNIVCAIQAAEARRRWVPFSQIHSFKFTMAEKIEQLCDREGGQGAAWTDLAEFDVERLLGLMVEMSAVPNCVQTLVGAIRQKLKNLGVL
jgi:hypothetical protein